MELNNKEEKNNNMNTLCGSKRGKPVKLYCDLQV